jgi:hypothetical protein
MMKKGKRRSAKEVKRLQEHFVQAINREGKITLTDLIAKYGGEISVKDTPTDKNLVKRQLDRAAKNGQILFHREGRNLVAQPLRKAPPAPVEVVSVLTPEVPQEPPLNLTVIRSYARQLEEVSRSLQEQISTLVRMVEKAIQ